MGWGSSKTTVGNQSQQQSNYNVSTPIQQGYAASLQSSLAPHYQKLIQEADQPVYGDAQKAGVLNNLNDLANASIKHLSSSLAGRGQLYSGEYDRGAAGIEQQRYGKASDFFSQLPGMERQAHMQNMASALGAANQYAASAPMGQASASSGTGTSDNYSKETSSPGLAGLIGGLAGMALGPLMGGLGGGLAGAVGGGGFTSGFGQAMNSMYQTPQWGGGGGGGFGGNYINSQGGMNGAPMPMPPAMPSFNQQWYSPYGR